MKDYEMKDYKVFDMFRNRWALVTAGTAEHYNTCTIAWGSLGTVWGRSVITVYVNPDRYTWEFLKESGTFSVSFFPEEYREKLSYLGSVSGRDGDKVSVSGLTPRFTAKGIDYEEAEATFICRKLWQGEITREGLAEEISGGVYRNWRPHWMFVGEIEEEC